MKLTCFVVTIQFVEDKCRKLTLFKNQVLNDLEQKVKDSTSPGKIHDYVVFLSLCFCCFICILWR